MYATATRNGKAHRNGCVSTLAIADYVYKIPIDKIQVAPFNPRNPKCPFKDRDNIDNPAVRHLAQSLAEVGQLVPVCVSRLTGDLFHLNDGHRRRAAAVLNEWECINGIITPLDPATVYRIINGFVKPHSSNAKLLTYLKDPLAVDPYTRVAYDNMVNHVGRKIVVRLAHDDKSYKTYTQACGIAKYCHMAGYAPFIRDILDWFIKTKTTFAARKAKEARVDPAYITATIIAGEKICVC